MALMEVFYDTAVRIPTLFVDVFIPVATVLGCLFAIFLWYRVSAIKVRSGEKRTGEDGRTFLLEEELTGEDSVRGLASSSQDHSVC